MSGGVRLAGDEKREGCGAGNAAADTEQDGALQACEIAGLRLRAELVVLSACETGRGGKPPGKGLIRLTRALQMAGARSVVASRCPAEDESTGALMTAFHQGLLQGLAKDEAMHQAMRSAQREKKWVYPYHWAAFVVTGDPR